MEIKNIADESFKPYGRVLTGEFDAAELIAALKKTEAPENSVEYVPSVEEFEALPVGQKIMESFFGGLPVQIGYCNGTNNNIVALPKGTNTELGEHVIRTSEDKLMTAKNKWLIAHKDAKIPGAFAGISGDNITI